MKHGLVTVSLFAALASCYGCGKGQVAVAEVKAWPITGTVDILTPDGVVMDADNSSDGNGSLRVVATAPTTIRLYETGDVDAEECRLIYRARLKTEGVVGKVYLEMWCTFPGRGEYFSRALQAPLSGNTEWTSQETPFFLDRGDNPDNVKLNLVVDGTGTAWIDDIHLVKGPMR